MQLNFVRDILKAETRVAFVMELFSSGGDEGSYRPKW